MKPFGSVQSKLFFVYSTLFSFVIIIFIAAFYFYVSRALEEKSSSSILQSSLGISDKFDLELKTMKSLADRIISSQEVRNHFFQTPDSPLAQLNQTRNLTNILSAVTGYPFQLYQVNLMRTDGYLFQFGKSFDAYSLAPEEITDKDWVRRALAKDGKEELTPPRRNDWDASGNVVLSMSRAFSEVFGARVDSLVEVQQSYDVFEQFIERSIALPGQPSSTRAYLYDPEGRLIFPFQADIAGLPDYWSFIRDHAAPSDVVRLTEKQLRRDHDADVQPQIVAYTRSEFSRWTVVLAESESELLQPVKAFRNKIVLLGLAALAAAMIITYFVSRELTLPLKAIRNSINRLSLKTLTPTKPSNANRSLNELELLNNSFVKMCERLEESLNDVVAARSQEIKARMLALQAQMNPHFLYNILTIMGIKAENNGQSDIADMCSHLSDMLRYIAVESIEPVTLRQEMAHARQYLNLMSIRHVGQFDCLIDVPESMLSFKVPRLIVQPIVENCFKYAFNRRPPWRIEIVGRRTRNRWEIVFTDNGVGFSDAMLQRLNNGSAVPPLSADTENASARIGLLNIRTRLNLFYNEKAIFQISNTPEGGAQVIIGGFGLTGDDIDNGDASV